jgi:xanthine/uracil permease
MNMQQPRTERSLGDLFSELTQETRTLVRQEVQLAKTELSEKVNQVQHGATSLAVGGLVAYAGLLFLLAAAVIGLAQVVEWWLAALVVGVIVTAIGLALVAKGRENLKAKNLTLNRTTESLQEDKRWAKAQMR